MRQTPLCGGIGVKKDKAQGRGFEPRPMEVGHPRGPGEPVVWCNRLPSIPQEVGGERGCGRYVLSASYLTHPPLKSSTYLRTRGRVDNEANGLTDGSGGDCSPSPSCGGSAGHPAQGCDCNPINPSNARELRS